MAMSSFSTFAAPSPPSNDQCSQPTVARTLEQELYLQNQNQIALDKAIHTTMDYSSPENDILSTTTANLNELSQASLDYFSNYTASPAKVCSMHSKRTSIPQSPAEHRISIVKSNEIKKEPTQCDKRWEAEKGTYLDMYLFKCGEGSSIAQAGPFVPKKKEAIDHISPQSLTFFFTRGRKGRAKNGREKGEGRGPSLCGCWSEVGESGRVWMGLQDRQHPNKRVSYCSVRKNAMSVGRVVVDSCVVSIGWILTVSQPSMVTCEYACLCTLYIDEPTARTNNFAAHTLE